MMIGFQGCEQAGSSQTGVEHSKVFSQTRPPKVTGIEHFVCICTLIGQPKVIDSEVSSLLGQVPSSLAGSGIKSQSAHTDAAL